MQRWTDTLLFILVWSLSLYWTCFCFTGEIDKQDELITHIRTFLETYKNIFDIEEEDANEDNEIKKLSVLSVNTITIFANLISSQSTIFSNEVSTNRAK